MHKKTKPTYLAVLLASIALVGAGVFLFDKHTSEADEVSPTEEEAFTVSADSTSVAEVTQVDVPVRGLVQPAQYVDVRAQVSGEISQLAVTEGDRVSSGSALFRQSQPVVEAEAAVARAQGERQQAEAQMIEAQEVYEVIQSQTEERTAAELALLREESSDAAVTTAKEALEVAIEETLTRLVIALDFINQERTYFDQAQQQQYQSVVQELYGGLPNYLVGPLRYPIDTPADLIEMLQSEDLEAAELAGLATLLDGQTEALLHVLTSAESEFYDADSTARDSGVLKTYLSTRESVIAARGSLRKADGQLWDSFLQGERDAVEAQRDISITQTDHKRQQQLATWRSIIADLVADVATAEMGVLDAQRTLGDVVAPWSGVVQAVLVEHGEYVQVGQPLLRLYSDAAREVRVNLPANDALPITAGTLLYQGDEVVGVVDRVATQAQTGRIVVYVSVTTDTVALGSVLEGSFRLPVPDGHRVVDRAAVAFTTHGPELRSADDVQSIEIVRDMGDTYLVRLVY